MSDFKAKIVYTKIDFGWGSSPDLLGELTALPRPCSWNKGDLLLRELKGTGRRRGEGREGEAEEGRKGKEREEGRKSKGEREEEEREGKGRTPHASLAARCII